MDLLHVGLQGAQIHGFVADWARDLLALTFPAGVALLSHSAFASHVGEGGLRLPRTACHHLSFAGVGGKSNAPEKSGESVNGRLEPVAVCG